jgi:hypothetical protein
MQGINASSVCDLMVEAQFVPGDHITQEFRKEAGIPVNFGTTMQFHVQRGVSSFKCYKRQLPDDVRRELLQPSFCLADPEQSAEGEELLLIHGIIGEDMINEMDESKISKVGAVGIKTTRTLFGDLVHGKSHFIQFPYEKGGLKMTEEQDFTLHRSIQSGFCQPIMIEEDNLVTSETNYLNTLGL